MGQGYSYKCERCDFTLEYLQGVGFLYPIEADKMLTDMLQGKFGKRFKEAANDATVPSVDFSHELYHCEKCGELRPDLKIELLDEGKVVLTKKHVCGKCRNKMRMIESQRGLKCPKCKSKLVIGDMVLWD